MADKAPDVSKTEQKTEPTSAAPANNRPVVTPANNKGAQPASTTDNKGVPLPSAEPTNAKSAPTNAKAEPTNAKAAPTNAKSAPTNAKTAPTNAKAAPTNAKAAVKAEGEAKSNESSNGEKGSKSKDEDKKPIFAYTQGKAWGGPTSTFGSLAFLSVFPFTGLLGIDHMYLRSPGSALLKMILNVVTFGMWYLYDAAQILSERDLVEKYGYSYPIVGPTGLGAGILAKGESEGKEAEEPVGPSPWRFLALCVFALLPIPFGLEYFAVGDTWGGITKVLSNFSWSLGVLQFFSAISGLYLIFRVFFKTESMLFQDGIPRTFPWTLVMDSDYCPVGTVAPASGCKKDEEPEESQGWLSFMKGWGVNLAWYKKYVGPAAEIVNMAKNAAKAVVPPATKAAVSGASLAAQAPTIEAQVTANAQAKYTDPNSLKDLYKKQQGQKGGSQPTETGATFMQNFAFIAALGVTVATGVYLAKLPSLKEVDVSFILPFSTKRKSGSGPDDTPPDATAV